MATNAPFARVLPKASKRSSGRTATRSTPLVIRSRLPVEPDLDEETRVLLGHKLGALAMSIERISVRFEDVNGPRGGVDTVCRMKVVLSGLPSVVVEERGVDQRRALLRAALTLDRAVRKTLDRAGWRTPKEETPVAGAPAARTPEQVDEGSLIGRRVGRSQKNLEAALARPEKVRGDVYVDTAAPGKSASDRKVGQGATARRNTRRNTARMGATLEDSRTRPSRKSTRKSANRQKAGAQQQRAQRRKVSAPKARATRAKARRPKR